MYGYMIEWTVHRGEYADTSDEKYHEREVFVSASRDEAFQAACCGMENLMKGDPDLKKLLPGYSLTEEDRKAEQEALDVGEEGNSFHDGYAHIVVRGTSYGCMDDIEYIQTQVVPMTVTEVSSELELKENEYSFQNDRSIMDFLNDCPELSVHDKKDFLAHFSQDEAFKVNDKGEVVPKYTQEEAESLAGEWTGKDGMKSFVVRCSDGAIGIVREANLGTGTIGTYCARNRCTLLSIV